MRLRFLIRLIVIIATICSITVSPYFVIITFVGFAFEYFDNFVLSFQTEAVTKIITNILENPNNYFVINNNLIVRKEKK